MTTTSTVRLSPAARAFVTSASRALAKQVKGFDARTDVGRVVAICNAVMHAIRVGYEGLDAAYSPAAYGLGWAYETGRINSATDQALRQMSTRDLLCLIAAMNEAHISIGESARWLMALDLQPAA